VPLLKKIFPRLQFVVTTHSPLVLAGFEREEILRLRMVDGQVEAHPEEVAPGVLSSSELLRSFFGVPRAGRPELLRKEDRYLDLTARSARSAEEEAEVERLREELTSYWPIAPDDLLPSAELVAEADLLAREGLA
jgi:hypothetical protein